MSIQLCWLRNDLRVEDNTALVQALASGPLVAIYIATPQQWKLHDDAPVKIDFWRRNLALLETSLQAIGVPLHFFQVDTYREIPALLEDIIQAWKVNGLHINLEYPLNESRRDEAVEAVCKKHQVAFHAYEDQCLLPPDYALTEQGRPFKVFTPFAKKTMAMLESAGSICSHGLTLQSQSDCKLSQLKKLEHERALVDIDWPAAKSWWQTTWPAGEDEAKRRLDVFIEEKIQDYQAARDYPAKHGTSTLSPYLCSGVISVRSCWEQAVGAGSSASVRSWLNELLWRDFYKYVMHHYPHVCMHNAWNEKYETIPWRHDEDDFSRWCQGETGFPLIDAAMKQLLETGWMHNRLRMLVAMFLSKNLLIDWRWGERWFMQHLIDGDFAANNGGWQWSASTGTDAAPYFRIFNPVTQSQRFDPDGEFIKTYLPALNGENPKSIHDPAKLSAAYHAPMIDLKFSRERALAAFRQ